MIRGDEESEHSVASAIVLAVLLTAGVLAGCGPAEVAEGPPPVRPIKMVEIGDALSTVNRQYPGRIAPALEAQLGFEVAGRIISFPVDEGQYVRQGQVLARLDPSDYEAQLDAAQADVKAAEADFERFRALLDKNAVSERDFQSRERNFEVAQSRLKIAEKKVADTRLTAHFSGRVARKLVDDYQNVQAKQPVAAVAGRIATPDQGGRAEADVTLGVPGGPGALEAWVTVTAYPDRAFEAEVAELSTAADPVTRTFEATLSFTPDDDVNVMPGMTARVSIAASWRRGAGVPASPVPAVCVATADDGAAYVWKVDPETLEVSRAIVEVGELTGANIVVRSGLSSGDLIAASGVHHLRQGMKVRRLGMNLAEFSINNRTVTLVLSAVLLFAGYQAFNGMSRLEDPEFTIKDALVITPVPRGFGGGGGRGGHRRDRNRRAEARPAQGDRVEIRPWTVHRHRDHPGQVRQLVAAPGLGRAAAQGRRRPEQPAAGRRRPRSSSTTTATCSGSSVSSTVRSTTTPSSRR